MSKHPYTILVNSSDLFADCWPPFFHLFAKFWVNPVAPILLNTESRHWNHPGLTIRCSQVGDLQLRRLTWSECLIRALSLVETPLVLYFQEDYFQEAPIKTVLVEEFAAKMLADSEIKHIGLTHFGSQPPFTPTEDVRLWRVGLKSPYRISTQVGLWRVETLLSYLRADENGWMFELYGTRRAHRRLETFLTVNRDLYSPQADPIVQYTHTGIIKGKWHPSMPQLFEKHGIAMDFSKRGFYNNVPALLRKFETARRMVGRPELLWKGMHGL